MHRVDSVFQYGPRFFNASGRPFIEPSTRSTQQITVPLISPLVSEKRSRGNRAQKNRRHRSADVSMMPSDDGRWQRAIHGAFFGSNMQTLSSRLLFDVSTEANFLMAFKTNGSSVVQNQRFERANNRTRCTRSWEDFEERSGERCFWRTSGLSIVRHFVSIRSTERVRAVLGRKHGLDRFELSSANWKNRNNIFRLRGAHYHPNHYRSEKTRPDCRHPLHEDKSR